MVYVFEEEVCEEEMSFMEYSGNCVTNCPESPMDISEKLVTKSTEISIAGKKGLNSNYDYNNYDCEVYRPRRRAFFFRREV